jgi:glycerophosphoryl diester phosphodiesterase
MPQPRKTRPALPLWGTLVLALGGAAWAAWRLQRPVATVAHRGGAATAPESTLAAYEAAKAAGIPAWELDVQLSSDGELMAFHDDDLDRTTNGHGPLAARSFAELRALDAGTWFGLRWAGERIPTFEEVIALAKTAAPQGVRLLVEIKSPHLYPGIEQRLIEVLDRTGYHDRVLIMSFDGLSLERVRALAPALPLVHLTAHDYPLPQGLAADAEVWGPAWQIAAANPLAVWMAHRAGRQVYTWTVNSPLAALWLRLIGVDGLISDRLDLLRAAGSKQ